MNKTMNSWLKLSMSHLKFRRTTSLSTLIALGLSTPLAHSVTLGELQLQSYVGQQFRGLVPYRLNAGESLNEQCIELLAANNELPSMGVATLSLRPSSELSGFVVVESRAAVGEPTVAFAIKVACGNQQITRDFTAFLNIAPVNNEREVLTRSSLREIAKKARDSELVPLKESEQFIVKKPITLKELTKRYYPANTPQYPRFLQKLSNTNPDLDPNAELSIGTMVIVPERLRSSSKKKPVFATESGQLRLDAATPASPSNTQPVSATQYAKELEQKVKMLEELQLKMQFEVEQLNRQLGQMNALNASSASQAAVAIASQPAIIATATIKPIIQASAVPQASPVPESQALAQYKSWLIGLGLLLFASIAAFFAWRRNKPDEEWSPEPAGAPTLLGQLSRLHKFKSTEHATLMSLHHPGAGIEVSDYGSNDLAQIQIMLAHGNVAEAIDLLYKSIDEDPEDIERWLMLFRIFRQQGMKTEYAALAKNLRMIVKDETDWELVRNIGAKLDPENQLYHRKENPVETIAATSLAHAKTLHVELDIHPEPTPATMMHAFLDIEAQPYVPQPRTAQAEPMSDILLDLHLPETTGDLIQDHQTLDIELEALAVFDVDFLPPLSTTATDFELEDPLPENKKNADQETKPPL